LKLGEKEKVLAYAYTHGGLGSRNNGLEIQPTQMITIARGISLFMHVSFAHSPHYKDIQSFLLEL
jgi:hypothetical protein